MKYLEGADYWIRYIEFPNMASPAVSVSNGDGTFTIYINTLFCPKRQTEALAHELEHLESQHFYRDDCEVAQLEAAADHIVPTPQPAEPPVLTPPPKTIKLFDSLSAVLEHFISTGDFQASIDAAHAAGIKIYGID